MEDRKKGHKKHLDVLKEEFCLSVRSTGLGSENLDKTFQCRVRERLQHKTYSPVEIWARGAAVKSSNNSIMHIHSLLEKRLG